MEDKYAVKDFQKLTEFYKHFCECCVFTFGKWTNFKTVVNKLIN